MSLGSKGPRFDPEGLHLLSKGKKGENEGRNNGNEGRGSLRLKGRS